MKKLLLATRGKVFTFKTLDKLVDCTRLKEFKSLWTAAAAWCSERSVGQHDAGRGWHWRGASRCKAIQEKHNFMPAACALKEINRKIFTFAGC
jgi:hypothetical protein